MYRELLPLLPKGSAVLIVGRPRGEKTAFTNQFVAHLSIFIGSYEVFKMYESHISDKLKTRKETAGKKRRKR